MRTKQEIDDEEDDLRKAENGFHFIKSISIGNLFTLPH